ncbi:hypothetical protein Lepil_3205 [Leptonema illini DSM 21528]|uniref:Lipoprotein n=1 Tax=Leptonema illini DSM 21528 TaxID=929563 RepID=H2CG19_9LEPT|nr:hypothetical protein Lepil_3205 [Leptonema illini DSM 21528]
MSKTVNRIREMKTNPKHHTAWSIVMLLLFASCVHGQVEPAVLERYFEGWSCAPYAAASEAHIPAHCDDRDRLSEYLYLIEYGASSQRAIDHGDLAEMAASCELSVRKRVQEEKFVAALLYSIQNMQEESPSGFVNPEEKRWMDRVTPVTRGWQRGVTACCAADNDSSDCISRTAATATAETCVCQIFMKVPGGRATLIRLTN